MSRARVPESLLAGAATIVVSWPLTTLFTPNTWVRPTIAMVALVVGAGMAARLLTSSKTLVVLAQLVVAVLAAGGLYGRGHLWHGLPTPDMVLAFNNLLVDARETIQNYAAPAPVNRGIILGIGLAMAATVVVVDHLAVMRRSPALAGLPLLTAFLLSASNSGSSLHPVYFLAAGAVWLLMMGRQGVASLRRWSTTAPMHTAGRPQADGDREGRYGFAATGRMLGIAGLAAAVVLPVAIPHLPTRYLVDGLGRSASATGFSDGQVGLSSTLDLTRSLRDPSTAPVLSYSSTATAADPLRVDVLTTYRDGQWRPDRTQVRYRGGVEVPPPAALDQAVPRKRYRVNVTQSRLEAPQLAAPAPLVEGDLGGIPWGLEEGTDVVRVRRSATSYSVEYLDLDPAMTQLQQPTVTSTSDPGHAQDLVVDPASRPTVDELLDRVVPRGADRIEAAMAIQEYLRSDGGFRYSLELAGPIENERHQVVQYDPLTHFLKTKVGYCIQFATAMVMMARASGIPARMAIGFLPGSFEHGTYTVRAADAHAWPELYFEGVGWLRFEPTPATRSGLAPDYSIAAVADPGDGTALPVPSGTATAPTRERTHDNDQGSSTDPATTGSRADKGFLGRWWRAGSLTLLAWLVLAILAGGLGSVAVPLAARARLRRRLREAEDDARRVEVQWQAMVERIGDLGVLPPRGSTPRQAGQFYQREAYLEGDESRALRRVVDTLERSRYAPPGTQLGDIHADADVVVRAVSGVRRRQDRLRAGWWPQEGVTEWRERRASAAARVRSLWDHVRRR